MRHVTLLLALCLPAAVGAAPPEVTYSKGGAMQLIFVNNPEQLYAQDLGDHDLGNQVILTLPLQPGGYRDYFEHLNLSGKTIGYGIQLYNPNPRAVTVRIHGSGFVTGTAGGRPFVQLFNGYAAQGKAHQVPPHHVLWVVRRDASVPHGSFFSGVVDFTVSGGPVYLHNYAYRRLWGIDGTAGYMGYIRRIGRYNSQNEARVYKGISPYSEVTASLDFEITDADHGELPVRYPGYDLTAGGFGPSQTRAQGWISNIGPAMNGDAVTGDMLAFDMPGWGVIDPLLRSDGTGDYPNLANWGVVHRLSGTVTNLGSYTRKLSINLRAPPGCNVVIAYRHGQGAWKELHIKSGGYIQYSWVTAPPTGQPVTYQASYVLGGPACGNLFQAVAVNN